MYEFAKLVTTFFLPGYVYLGYCCINFIRWWISLDRKLIWDKLEEGRLFERNRKQWHLLTSSGDLYFTIQTWSTTQYIRGGQTNPSEMWRVNRPAMLWVWGADCFGRVWVVPLIFFTKRFFYLCPSRRKSTGLTIQNKLLLWFFLGRLAILACCARIEDRVQRLRITRSDWGVTCRWLPSPN